MNFARNLGLAAALAALLSAPVYAAAADNYMPCGSLAMAENSGGGSGEAEHMTADEQSERQENMSEQQEFDKRKFDIKLQRRLREQPIDAENGETTVRVTAKTTDRGEEMRRFIKENGGNLGSCHGNIITAQMPYRTLPDLSRLETVVRIEGYIKLFPQTKKADGAE